MKCAICHEQNPVYKFERFKKDVEPKTDERGYPIRETEEVYACVTCGLSWSRQGSA